MKLTPVTKFDKSNMATSKKIGNDVMSVNCDITVIFPIYGQFGENQRLDSRHMVYRTYIFSRRNLLSYKN